MFEPRIGTAGWSIPGALRDAFPAEGSHLERYAARFNAVEINSSFYRPHRRSTYQRWAATVGRDFRFAVKLPKAVSHAKPGVAVKPAIERFGDEIEGLGEKLGVVLIQFPPSRVYEAGQADELFALLRDGLPCLLVYEPRHDSWFENGVGAALDGLRIARVAADPAIVPEAGNPGGWPGARYRRLHGAPHVYYSDYPPAVLRSVRETISREGAAGVETWTIFDNTALGAATANALDLLAM